MTQKHHISAYSKGLYSSWVWAHAYRTLFDCGPGFSLYAANYIYGVERICLSHSDLDHVGDLASVIGTRNSARGAKDKDLDIYYPFDDMRISIHRQFIENLYGRWMKFKLNWIPFLPQQKIQLDNNHWIESFVMQHTKRSTTLGYKIVEARSRLKPEYRNMDIPTAIREGKIDPKNINEPYTQILLAYCLDAYKLNPTDIVGANLAIMDCSFLKDGDRDSATHATLNESREFARIAGVKQMAVAHISSRYSMNDINEAVKPTDNHIVINPFKVNEF